MNQTGIEYLTHTWNVTHGCDPISEGCRECWAEAMARRLAGMGKRGYSKEDPFKPTFCPWKLEEPLHVKKPAVIGVSYMGDLFHDRIEWNWQYKIFEMMLHACWHTFIILTKRPKPKTVDLLYFHLKRNYDCHIIPLPNVWFGVSVENQQRLDRWHILSKIPASKRFISFEPLLSNIKFLHSIHCPIYEHNPKKPMPVIWSNGCTCVKPDWAIAGCESGSNRRPAKIEWFRDLKDQCVDAGVPFFLKQWEYEGFQKGYSVLEKMPRLDGQIWNELPL